jgi:hypothetical protein
MTLTPRDIDLLQSLSNHIRILSVDHIAAIWWPDAKNQRTTRHRLGELKHWGWIMQYTVNAHPPLPVTSPLFTWMPGTSGPDAERIACESRARWSQPSCPTEICVATPVTAGLFGSATRRLPPPEHRDHDLRLAAVYTYYRTHRRQMTNLWVGKHALPKVGYQQKSPDAVLRDSDGRVIGVIHSAGRYHTAQVESLHSYCVENNLPYELW